MFNNILSFIGSNMTLVERKLYRQKQNIARNTAQNSCLDSNVSFVVDAVNLSIQSVPFGW